MILIEHLVAHNFKQLREVDLEIPSSCRVLIDGLNEAGKSTLFEAVHFALYGRGLVTRGRGHGVTDGLIAHGEDRARVEVGLRVDDLSLRITRDLIRGRTGQASCQVQTSDGGSEEVRQIKRVNDEVLVQLSGLDSDALLASCLVEQKKLGKLEDLSREKRQEVLLKLLDLDRLTRVKRRFGLERRDDVVLHTAEQKARLAEATRLIAELSVQAVTVKELSAKLGEIGELDRAAERARSQQRRLAEAGDLGVGARELEENAPGMGEVGNRAAEAEERVQRARLVGALREWGQAAREAASRQGGEKLIAELDRAADAARTHHRESVRRARKATLVLAGTLGVTLVGILALALSPLALIITLVGAGFTIWSWRRRSTALAHLRRAVAVLDSKLATANDERIRQETLVGKSPTDVAGRAVRIGELRGRIPDSPQAADAQAEKLEQALPVGWSVATLRQEALALREESLVDQLASIAGRRRTLEVEVSELSVGSLIDRTGSMAEVIDKIEESERALLPLLRELASASAGQIAGLVAALEAARVELLGKQRAEERVAADLEARLHLQRGDLDELACREEAERLRQRKRTYEQVIAVLDRVRENVLEAVLPNTMAYMRLLLPLLTAGRYHDAQLDSESYRIEVWENQFQEFVEKDIFSGATQDQFSLTLRLGFALSALPQERGARPGFLFLDEPVAGFDGQRRDALLNLLTNGEWADYFPQVFLAVPSGVFERNPLPHLVRLDHGRVVENTLPAASRSGGQ